MVAIVAVVGFVYMNQQGRSNTAVETKPSSSPTKSQPQGYPESLKPRDEAKKAADSLQEYALKQVESLQRFVDNTVRMRLSTGAVFEYRIESLKLRDIDVRKTDSLTTTLVGTIQVDVLYKLNDVTGFPREFVPYSAESPVKRVDVECMRKGTVWELKSPEEMTRAILTPPK